MPAQGTSTLSAELTWVKHFTQLCSYAKPSTSSLALMTSGLVYLPQVLHCSSVLVAPGCDNHPHSKCTPAVKHSRKTSEQYSEERIAQYSLVLLCLFHLDARCDIKAHAQHDRRLS